MSHQFAAFGAGVNPLTLVLCGMGLGPGFISSICPVYGWRGARGHFHDHRPCREDRTLAIAPARNRAVRRGDDTILAARHRRAAYQSWKGRKHRRIAPLGLVLKGGNWYLAGLVDNSVRTYRIARVQSCTVLEAGFDRPDACDLAAYWRASIERLESELHPNKATIRLSPLGLKLFDALSHPYVKARACIEEAAGVDGWRTAVIPTGKTTWHAASELLRLGSEVEVLEQIELRERMAEMTRAMADRYAAQPRK